jgi:hypothetical protein
MILRERAHALAVCKHPEETRQLYKLDGAPWRVCGLCGARKRGEDRAWRMPPLVESVVRRVQAQAGEPNIIGAEIEAMDTTRAALAAWLRTANANAAILKDPCSTENDRRIARAGERQAHAFAAMLVAIVAKTKADA